MPLLMSYIPVDCAELPVVHCTEVRFASFLSGGFITVIVVNPPEKNLAKRTSVHWLKNLNVILIEFLE